MEVEKIKAGPTRATRTPIIVLGQPQEAQKPNFEIDAAVGALGLIFFNSDNASWLSASDKKQTMAESFSVLTTALNKHDRLRFSIAVDDLKVNGEPLEFKSQYAKAFVVHLTTLALNNFALTKGLAPEEFARMIDLMCKRPEELLAMGGLTDLLINTDMEHVSAKKILLREVSDDEVVVAKSDFASASAEERRQIESDIVSMLSDPTAPQDPNKTTNLKEVVQDSSKMTDLIMQAVDKKNVSLPEADRQKVSEVVVDCLDRAFAALIDDPFSKTQKGKKAIAGALKNLEKELLSRMSTAPAPDPQGEGLVQNAVERMTERLKMDAIAQDYAKKLKSLEESEKRILRFMKLQGLDRLKDTDLQGSLTDEGVDVSGWHKLLALSAAPDVAELDPTQESHHAVTKLADMLDQLVTKVESSRKEPAEKTQEEILQGLIEANAQANVVAQHAQRTIDDMVAAVSSDLEAVEALEKAASASGQGPKMSRRRLLNMLGEVVQELCQPISVISCTLEMLQGGVFGEVPAAQLDMLKLIAESSVRMHTLVLNLGKLSGQPTTRSPDKTIQEALYKA